MGKLLAGMIGIAVLLLGGALLWPREPSAAQAAYDAQRWADQLAADRWWDGFWRAVLVGAMSLLAVAVVGGLVVLFWKAALANVQTAQAPARRMVQLGPVVVPAAHLLNGRAAPLLPPIIEGHYAAQLAQAQRGGTPQSIHYAPQSHYAYANDVRGAAPVITEVPPLTLPAPVPAFDALLDQGIIGTGRPLLLGYADGAPLTGTWKDLYSSAVAGISGSGKTTTLRFLAAQSALQGARFLLLDPHADAGDESLAGTLAPLAAAFLAPPAADPKAMLALLDTATGIMQARLTGQTREAYPLIVAVDEMTALMGRSDLAGPLAALVEGIAQEGRKVGCFALVSGQIFTADRAGGSALRDALASAYVHRMRRSQARLLINTEDARRAEGLHPGQALLSRNTGDVLDIAIPNTTAAHMARVGALLATGQATPLATNVIDLATRQATPARAPVATATPTGSLEATRALALFRQHKSMARVVEEMHGITSDQGRKYQTKLAEVSALVADAIEGLAP